MPNEDQTRPLFSTGQIADLDEPLDSVPTQPVKDASPARSANAAAKKGKGGHGVQHEADRISATPASIASEQKSSADPEAVALYLGAFFNELKRCGVKDFVVSSGARSTALAMVAFEVAGDVYVDVDERSAAFFALGLAKATGNPVGVICTSGTAPANWFPAVLEAEASRVPLLLLSADRPLRLHNIAAHQTTDQLNLFGSHVKAFYQMPLPAADLASVSYARQVALDACVTAHGVMPGAQSCDGGPVHLNFPFEEPLTPARVGSVQTQLAQLPVRRTERGLPPTVVPGQVLLPADAAGLLKTLDGKRVVALCGEGTCNSEDDIRALVAFAEARKVPLVADPLSGMRTTTSDYVIDNYDTALADTNLPMPDVIVRFGRWPVSKRCTTKLGECGAVQLVVDMRDTRDANAATTTLVRTSPVAFARAMVEAEGAQEADEIFARMWIAANEEAGRRISSVASLTNVDNFEGAYIERLFDLVPDGSLVFSASSMSIRAIDTFYLKSAKRIKLLCNRGLSGIDGTLSAAFGAAQAFLQTTVVTGDLAFLHDSSALALQRELRTRKERGTCEAPSIVVVVLNNGGGAIFDMLPQQSSDDYFSRLFLTPQDFSVKELAQAHNIEYRRARTVADFGRVYSMLLGQPGISIIEVPLPLEGVKERYARYW